jgi:hypothetical protein
MTVHTARHKVKGLLIRRTASVHAAAPAGASATDGRTPAEAVAVRIETGLFASSPTRLDRGRVTLVIGNARR